MARPKKDPENVNIKMSISFTPDHYKKLVSYCEKEERFASWVVRKALDDWFIKHGIE